ncbi:hypothetical protein [Hymenobacter volaticus]|uniref:Uncharacterized protein n=1 Tax=Hymenobacter volaticus TaxID=2932254 RepID=A0ABY4GG44_9BACT|nr:hypothetical protein [Hymenobacter volaticus]UOQ69439.1 hypothetical protein MUN86_28565 [Hymenobacter volaticus]
MHFSLQNVFFLVVVALGFGLFSWQASRIRANILIGRDREVRGRFSKDPGKRSS